MEAQGQPLTAGGSVSAVPMDIDSSGDGGKHGKKHGRDEHGM